MLFANCGLWVMTPHSVFKMETTDSSETVTI